MNALQEQMLELRKERDKINSIYIVLNRFMFLSPKISTRQKENELIEKRCNKNYDMFLKKSIEGESEMKFPMTQCNPALMNESSITCRLLNRMGNKDR